MTENEISFQIIGASIKLHKYLGPGMLESVYENALAFDLSKLGFRVEQQVPIPFYYMELKQQVGFRINLLVNKKVLIEIKSVENLVPVHYSQVLTYLRLSNLKLGLLINFNCNYLKEGIHRLVNNL